MFTNNYSSHKANGAGDNDDDDDSGYLPVIIAASCACVLLLLIAIFLIVIIVRVKRRGKDSKFCLCIQILYFVQMILTYRGQEYNQMEWLIWKYIVFK